jgi:hypothetical protein
VQRNADVIWLENWSPTAILYPEHYLKMTFLHAEYAIKIENGLGKVGSYIRYIVVRFNMSLIVKRLASLSIQDTVYSRQIPRYLESYIPVYTYRYVGIWLSMYYRLYP